MSKCATPQAESDVLERIDFFLPDKGQSVGIVGVSQNGKTTLAFEWLEALGKGLVRRLAWDPSWQFGKDALLREGSRPGPLERTVTVEELEADPALLLAPRLSLAVRPVDIWATDKEIAEQFVRFGRVVIRAHPGGRLVLFMDECHMLRAIAEAEAMMDAMAERWGKEGIVPFYVTQRWGHLTPNTRAQLGLVVSFHQNKASDLRFLRDDAGRELAAAVARLQPYEYRARFLRRALPETLAELG